MISVLESHGACAYIEPPIVLARGTLALLAIAFTLITEGALTLCFPVRAPGRFTTHLRFAKPADFFDFIVPPPPTMVYTAQKTNTFDASLPEGKVLVLVALSLKTHSTHLCPRGKSLQGASGSSKFLNLTRTRTKRRTLSCTLGAKKSLEGERRRRARRDCFLYRPLKMQGSNPLSELH